MKPQACRFDGPHFCECELHLVADIYQVMDILISNIEKNESEDSDDEVQFLQELPPPVIKKRKIEMIDGLTFAKIKFHSKSRQVRKFKPTAEGNMDIRDYMSKK